MIKIKTILIITIIIKKINIKTKIKTMRMKMRMRMRMRMRVTIIMKIFFTEQNIKISYYWFNREEILEKAEKKYSKKKLLSIICKIKNS